MLALRGDREGPASVLSRLGTSEMRARTRTAPTAGPSCPSALPDGGPECPMPGWTRIGCWRRRRPLPAATRSASTLLFSGEGIALGRDARAPLLDVGRSRHLCLAKRVPGTPGRRSHRRGTGPRPPPLSGVRAGGDPLLRATSRPTGRRRAPQWAPPAEASAAPRRPRRRARSPIPGRGGSAEWPRPSPGTPR